jgi:hypothetical protein
MKPKAPTPAALAAAFAPQPDPLDRLVAVASDLRNVQPLVGHFIVSAVGMTRSGEMSRRPLGAASLAVANRLGSEHRAFADQLRGAVQGVLAEQPPLVRPALIEQDVAP